MSDSMLDCWQGALAQMQAAGLEEMVGGDEDAELAAALALPRSEPLRRLAGLATMHVACGECCEQDSACSTVWHDCRVAVKYIARTFLVGTDSWRHSMQHTFTSSRR